MNYRYWSVSRNIRKVALFIMAPIIAVTACAFTACSMSNAAEAGASSSASKAKSSRRHAIRNVLLVHGSFADGSSWSKVIRRLADEGLHVTAVQLALTSVSDDVATVARAIALEDGPVVLVGHSYGGAVITEAGNDPKVSALVYVAGFAPDQGESLGSLLATVPPSPLLSTSTTDAFGFIKITPAGIADNFAQDVGAEEKIILTATQGPSSAATFKTVITAPAWKSKPSWYLVTTEDRAIPPQLQRTMSSRMGAHTTAVRSSHAAMISHPEEVTKVIEEATE